MNILLPTTITEAMFGAGTSIPAVDTDAGEVGWATGVNYAVGDRRIDAGYTYECVKAVDSAPQNTYAPSDPRSGKHWLKDEGAPSNRMAPFDEYIYTKAKKAGELKYSLIPGFFNGFWLGGVEADEIDVVLRDEVGGVVLAEETRPMWEQAFGEFEYLFGNLRRETKLSRSGLPMRPASELEITLRRNDPNVLAELGTLSIGQWRTLLAPTRNHGGTEYGVEVTPKSYAYFKRNDDGTYTRRQGRQAKVITASVLIDAQQAPAASDLLQRIMDVPVAVEATDLPKYGHISTFGFVTGSVIAETWRTARVNIKVEGNV